MITSFLADFTDIQRLLLKGKKSAHTFQKGIIVVTLPAEEKAETNLLVECEEAVI